MLLSAVSVLVVTQSSSEIPEGLMNNPVEYVQLFNNVLFLETKVYMVGCNMLTLQSPGILHHVHL